MHILTQEDLNDPSTLQSLKESLFIYPTDTIYGIGCDATNEALVQQLRDIKQRPKKPMSIIPPSKEWIKENCVLTEKAQKYIDALGDFITIDGKQKPFSLIIKLKNKQAIAHNVIFDLEAISLRMPKHWFTSIVQKINVPIITTSVNKSDEPFMTSLDDLDKDIKTSVPYCIYEGEKQGTPSTLIHIKENAIIVTKR